MKKNVLNLVGCLSALLTMVVLISCSSSSTQPSTPSSVEGRYSVTWTRSAASCTPSLLSAPMSSDTSQYAQVPAQAKSFQGLVQVQLSGSAVSLVPLNANGVVVSSLALNGAFVPVVPILLSRQSTLNEGPRVGGRTYFVTETQADTVQFQLLVQTPPGNQIESHLSAKGAVTITFREGASSGPIYTTCKFTESVVGSRESQ